MGGFGSGRPQSRLTVEDAHPLDLPKLMRDGLVGPGANGGRLVWRIVGTDTETGSVGYTAELNPAGPHGHIRLRYTVTDSWGDRHDVDEWIELEARPQPFGGHQWLMVCPISGRACRKLYLPPGGRRFAARQVYRLAYRSQGQAPYDRATTQAQRLRRRLGASQALGDWIERPHGMRRRTFDRHVARIEHYEEIIERHLFGLVTRLGGLDVLPTDETPL